MSDLEKLQNITHHYRKSLAAYEARTGNKAPSVDDRGSGDERQAKIALDKGFYISFTGVVTFKNTETARQAAKIVPLDRLMLETDCPYMSPAPMRNQKVNEPALMIHTAKFLAALKNIDLEDFAQAVTATSRKFFGL